MTQVNNVKPGAVVNTTDNEFAETAVKHKFVKPQDMNDAMFEAENTGRSVIDVLLERGLLNSALVERVHEISAEAKKTPRLGNFEIISKLATGGMGTVYRAVQTSLDREVAVKILSRRLSNNERFIERFLHEAKLAAKLSHPNIVTVFEAGKDRGYYYFVMELIQGNSVDVLLKEQGALSEKEALRITRDVAQALEYARKNNMVHRDIKPSNILVGQDSTVKLADLGIAHSAGENGQGPNRSGSTMGTPHYISPEQVRGDSDIDIRSDIYSLGMTLYYMVTGRKPFEETTIAAVLLSRQIKEDPAPANRVNPKVSPGTAAVIRKMTAKKPEERYSTPAQLIKDLDLAFRGATPKALRDFSAQNRAAAAVKKRAGKPEEAVSRQKTDKYTVRSADRKAASNRTFIAAVSILGAVLVVMIIAILVTSNAPKPEEFTARIERFIEAGSLQEALDELKEARSVFPEEKGFQSLKERIDKKVHDKEGKARRIEEARKRRVKEEKAGSLIAEARSFRNTGDLQKAQLKIEKVLELIPDHAEAGSMFSEIQQEITAGQLEAARKKKYDTWIARAEEFKSARSFIKAEGAYKKAAEFSPHGSSEARESAKKMRAEILRNPKSLKQVIGKCSRDELSHIPQKVLESVLLNMSKISADKILLRLESGSVPKTFLLRQTVLAKGWAELKGHKKDVRAVAFSPDGRFIATAGNDSTTVLWDIKTGTCLRKFEGNSAWFTSVAFSPDSRFITAASEEGTAVLWDVQTGRSQKTFKDEAGMRSIAFSPDGKSLLTASCNNAVFVWDIRAVKAVQKLEAHTSMVDSIAFSSNGRFIASTSWDGTAVLWDSSDGIKLRTLQAHNGGACTVAFVPDGRHMATGGRDNTAALWNVSTGSRLKVFKGHNGTVYSVDFSPDGRILATGSWDGTAVLWDVRTGRSLKTFKGHGKGIWSVAFSPDGYYIATGSADGTARIWRVSGNR